MTIEPAHWMNLLPECLLLVGATLAILIDLCVGKTVKSASLLVAQICLLLCLVFVIPQYGDYRQVSLGGLFVMDDMAVILKVFIYISAFLSFSYATHYLQEKDIAFGETYMLGLFSVLGMSVLVSSHHYITLYMGLELMSLPMYGMIALMRRSSRSTESAMKYFVMGAVASAMLLYGMSIMYGAVGSLEMSQIAAGMSQALTTKPLMLNFALTFLLVGVCFKLALVPFHMWAPDVYDGAPTAMSCFISSAPKVAAVGMLFRLIVLSLPALQLQWQPILVLVATLSVLVGNILALVQMNIKRLLAYSSVAHMGYMLLGIIAGGSEGYASAVLYAGIYGITTVAGFGLVVIISRLGLDATQLDDLKGLNARSPWLAAMMLIILLSMAGVPPTIGFFAKLMIFKALVSAQQVGIALFGLVLAVVGGFNYLRVIKTMYFEAPIAPTYLVVDGQQQFWLSINALVLLALGMFPNGLVHICLQAFAK